MKKSRSTKNFRISESIRESEEEDGSPGLVPKLRFSEFRAAMKWHPYVLEQLEDFGWVEIGRGEVISSQDIKAIPGDYPIYSSSVKNNGLMGTYGRFMFDEELISWSVDGGGDFFYRPRHKFSVTNVSGYMRLNTSRLNYRFLASHLQALHASLTFDYQFKAHPSVIRKLYRLAIPTLAEQRKIASCLSSLDELIRAQGRKVDALRTHKKGLMQQLFPREGETQPRLRFPEFQNAGEWQIKHLGKVAENLDSQRVPVTSGDRKVGNIPYYGASGIVDYVDGFIFDEELLCISEDGANLVARTNPIAFPISGKTWVNNHAHVLRFENLYTQKFVELYLNSIKLDDFITGMAQPKLNRAMLDRIPIPFPDFPEQQRIALCLSSLDDLITAETQKLEALRTHKRGLMQQLFPSPGND